MLERSRSIDTTKQSLLKFITISLLQHSQVFRASSPPSEADKLVELCAPSVGSSAGAGGASLHGTILYFSRFLVTC